MKPDLRFLFGVHNHQPVGNFDHVIAEACRQAYRPFLETLREFPEVVLSVHISGGLLEWLKEHAGPTFDLLGGLVQQGRIELLTGGFYEPILPVLPDWDKIGQIQRLSEFLQRHFGVRARGMWLAERVWEPHLAKPLRQAGVEYVLVDDSHFALAGLDPDRLQGYYLTEEQGETLAVFPINMRLRYLVPFATPDKVLEFLESRRERARGVTLMDDGEKFGVWPGTHRVVYIGGWLRQFFKILASAEWLRFTTFSRYLDQFPPTDRIYLPTGAYREMGEWALPADAGEALVAAKEQLRALPDGEVWTGWLRGGFWRNFLVKYPEAGDCHWKMLRLSRAIQAALSARPDDPRLAAALIELWRGQGNDSYWHGVFGGIYLPHLRRATKQALIAADRLLADATAGDPVRWGHEDINGDGRAEVWIRTPALSLTLHPESGGSLTELAYLPKRLDLADVLTRRREAYHAQLKAVPTETNPAEVKTIHERIVSKESGLEALLGYDRFRRASFLDGLFPSTGALDPLDPWELAIVALADCRMESVVSRGGDAVTARFLAGSPHGQPLEIRKEVSVAAQAPTLRVTYRLQWSGNKTLEARWAIQLNLALTAGDVPDRYLKLPGKRSLARPGAVEACEALSLVDEWAGLEVALRLGRAARVAWAPVETVSLSEAGFERIYQGSAILFSWPLTLRPAGEWEETIIASVLDIPPRGK